LPVTLDFDNTIVCGDIGEATLAVLVKKGVLSPKRISPTLSPSFRLPNGTSTRMDAGPDITSYYDAFLAPTAHGAADPTPLANGYAWAVEIMEGLRPFDVTTATAEAFAVSEPLRQRWIEVTPGKTAFPAPFFYSQMVELIATLRRHDFDVWIVSASNVWSVRWMISQGLNPLLRKAHAPGIPPDHVVGVSTLLQDSDGRLYKDSVLVREDQRYAALDEAALKAFCLTSRLQFPVPTYSGKVGCIWDVIGRQPYLSAGDSPGDLPMLAFSEHRLWLARLEKPGYQRTAADRMSQTGRKGWMVQPLLAKETTGFLSTVSVDPRWSPSLQQAVGDSIRNLGLV
jgi:hypothetical protein